IRKVRAVDWRSERERTAHVYSNVGECVAVGPGVSASQNQLFATGQPPQYSILAAARIPAKTKARLEVVFVSLWNRVETEPLVPPGSLDDPPTCRHETQH